MNDLSKTIVCRLWPLVLLLFFTLPAAAADGPGELIKPPAGLSAAEAFRLGETMYRMGILPSGEPMVGFVQGDIKVSGRILTCSNCHMRSGLGSYEGGVTTLPTNGAKLYSPLRNGYDLPSTSMGLRPLTAPRPAYTDADLAAALMEGIDPAGRVLSETMPRYVLDDRQTDIMIYYLKNLSSTLSPGATLDVLRLATVVSDGVSDADRKSMIDPLMSFTNRFPRKLILDVWELKGPRESWKKQLEEQYRKQPVFALLSGRVQGSWRPVHEFCEQNSIPALLPITDLPVVSDKDLYTLYLSKGYYQEGEAAAKYLAHVVDAKKGGQMVQVMRETEESKALAQGYSETWKKLGSGAAIDKIIPASQTCDKEFWRKLAEDYPDAVLLLWLEQIDLEGIEAVAGGRKKPAMVFASSTLLKENFAAIPEQIRHLSYITYPYGLPEERTRSRANVEQFWRGRNVHPVNKAIAEKVFSGIGLFSQAFGGLKSNRYRDYFLDLFDMMEDQTGYGVRYPRLSFGPGQRYASKGCYIITLGQGAQPQLMKKSDWIIY